MKINHGLEAEKLYAALYGDRPPSVLKERYARAAERLEAGYEAHEAEACFQKIVKAGDIEAFEFASRIFGRNRMLSDKIRIMVHLGETRPENYRLFINENACVLKANWMMIQIVFSSLWKLLKGMILLAVVKP
jgi:hypothetical protein